MQTVILSRCLREPSAVHAHQPQSKGYYTMRLFVRPYLAKSGKLPCDLVPARCNS